MRCLPSIHVHGQQTVSGFESYTCNPPSYPCIRRRDASAAAALSPSRYHAHDPIPPSPLQKIFRLTPSPPPPSPSPSSPRPYPYTCGHMHRGRHHQRIGSPYTLHTRLETIMISLTTAAPTGWAHSHLTFYPTGFGVTCAVLAIDSWSWPTECKWL